MSFLEISWLYKQVVPFDRPCLSHRFACCSVSVSLLYIELQALHAVIALPLLWLYQTFSCMGYISGPHMPRSVCQKAGFCTQSGVHCSRCIVITHVLCMGCRQQQRCSLCSAEPMRSYVATLMDPTTPLPCKGPCNAPTSHQKKMFFSYMSLGVSIHGCLLF